MCLLRAWHVFTLVCSSFRGLSGCTDGVQWRHVALLTSVRSVLLRSLTCHWSCRLSRGSQLYFSSMYLLPVSRLRFDPRRAPGYTPTSRPKMLTSAVLLALLCGAVDVTGEFTHRRVYITFA